MSLLVMNLPVNHGMTASLLLSGWFFSNAQLKTKRSPKQINCSTKDYIVIPFSSSPIILPEPVVAEQRPVAGYTNTEQKLLRHRLLMHVVLLSSFFPPLHYLISKARLPKAAFKFAAISGECLS